MTDREREILDYLADHGASDLTEVAAALDDHPVTVDQCCYRLQQEGSIRLVGEARYMLTADGERHL